MYKFLRSLSSILKGIFGSNPFPIPLPFIVPSRPQILLKRVESKDLNHIQFFERLLNLYIYRDLPRVLVLEEDGANEVQYDSFKNTQPSPWLKNL